VTLIDETQGRNDEDLMFDTGVLNGYEVFQEPMVNTATTRSSIPDSVADPVTTADGVVTIASVKILEELTLAQTLIEIKSAKPKAVTTVATTVTPASSRPKAKGIVFYDQEEQAPASTPIVSPSKSSQVKDKAEQQQEERIAREKAQKIQEANIAWDDIQATVEVDYQLAQRLHDEEQEQYTNEEKEKFFCEFLEQRRKFFAAKRDRESYICMSTRSSTRNLFPPLEDSRVQFEKELELMSLNSLNDFEEINMAANKNGDDGLPPAGGGLQFRSFERWSGCAQPSLNGRGWTFARYDNLRQLILDLRMT
ncbi:hypothetical protein Tco_0916080, partial [Tanacetum coccineum]